MGEPGGGRTRAGAAPAGLCAHLPLFFPIPCKLSLPLARVPTPLPSSERAVPITDTSGFITPREVSCDHPTPLSVTGLARDTLPQCCQQEMRMNQLKGFWGRCFSLPREACPQEETPSLTGNSVLSGGMPKAAVIWRSWEAQLTGGGWQSGRMGPNELRNLGAMLLKTYCYV